MASKSPKGKTDRFSHVKAKVDTGASLKRHQEKLEYISTRYRFRKGEQFRRIKCTTLARLMLELQPMWDSLRSEAEPVEAEGANGLAPPSRGIHDDAASNVSTASSFASFAFGQGERSSDQPIRAPPKPEFPLLIVDVRDREDYEQAHLRGAVSMPHTRLSRATNALIPDVARYRNAEGTLVVIYDFDEKISTKVGEILSQRGFENLFVLSGGLQVWRETIPPGMVIGDALDDGTMLQELTAANLDSIQDRLDQLELDADAASTRSSRASSRATATRGTAASSRQAPQRAGSVASTTRKWR